jgi:hypothetical protein
VVSLPEDLQEQKSDILQFKELALRILRYIPDVLNEQSEFNGYVICSSNIAGSRKSIRPFKENLFIRNVDIFEENYIAFEKIISRLNAGVRTFNEDDHQIVNSVVYTIQQAVGIGLDLLV